MSDKGSSVSPSPQPTQSSGAHVGSRWVKQSTGLGVPRPRACRSLLRAWAKLSPPPEFSSSITRGLSAKTCVHELV